MPQLSTAALNDELRSLLEGFPPIVCFGNDIEGDPTSKHHIMRILAEHVPVTWVESAGMRVPRLGNLSDLKRIAHRLRRATKPPTEARIRVLSPLGIPLPGSRTAQRINGVLYRRAVARTNSAGRLPLLWVYIPTVAPYLGRMQSCGLVYHCVDRWWAFSEYDEEIMRRHHAHLCRTAASVFASSNELLEDCRTHAPSARLLPHGVDWEHFARAAEGTLGLPADIGDIQGPVIGFFGLLHDWIDQRLIIEVARENPAATVLLVGKVRVDLSALLAEPNVRWIGQRPFADLPAYAARFDVALIPFQLNSLTAAVSPLKLLEYLAAGVPVVATALPEVVKLEERPDLHVGRTAAEFRGHVRRVLARPPSREDRLATSRREVGESWIGRCIQIVRAIRLDNPSLIQ